MQFLNPVWLWGLTGLLIPIGIHLLSRKEGKTIKIGSIRHLDETSTTRFRSLRLQEISLLAFRCLLITLLVFLFSDPIVVGIEKKEKWLLVEKGLEKDPDFVSLIDSLKNNGFQMKALAEGFPNFTDASARKEDIHYYDLLEALKKRSIQQAIVIAHNHFDGFKGRRSALPANIQWITKSQSAHTFTLYGYSLPEDSVLLRTGTSTSAKTSLHFQQTEIGSLNALDTLKLEAPPKLVITIFTDSSFSYDGKILEAALHAIDNIIPGEFSIKSHSTKNYMPDIKTDWLILLGEKFLPVPDQKTIHFRKSLEGHTKLFVQLPNTGSEASWMLTRRLNEEVALTENLTVQLASILFSESKYKALLKHNDRRAMPEKILWASIDKSKSIPFISQDVTKVQNYILILLLLFLLIERSISFKQNQ